jgi:hypothetical protein
MFGNKKGNKKDVDKVLAKGQAFIEELDDCVACTKADAERKQSEIDKLTAERNELDLKAKKGAIVSKRVNALLTITDEDLEAED